ncbi:MAG: hypothetical protein CMK09_06345 [Ponticaulis sp.]|nr:hypothetical protein [Ponticaulis sp.]|tara:strand:+ start:5178 stop:5804 length:627 start_codon:yes stop_codon:yes gene_type:complete
MPGLSIPGVRAFSIKEKQRELRQKLSRFLDGPWALPFCALIGFLENTIILFAMEPLFLPAMAARGRKAWQIAAALLVGNVIAAFAMYALGMWAGSAIIEPAFASFNATETYHELIGKLNEDCFWPLFMVGITPIPFQLGAAAAGAAGCSLLVFAAAITISRAIRYFTEAGIIMALGERGEKWIEQHELEIFVLGIGIFIGMAVMFFLF